MGRIGKRELIVPPGVEIKISAASFQVKGPKGTLAQEYKPGIKIEFKDGKLLTICHSKDPQALALQGLYNSLAKNMIDGVTKGFEKRLELVGVGYRAAKQGKGLQMSLGYSHPIIIEPPAGIDFEVEGQNKITVKGIDKQLVGELAAEIRQMRKVEPYKGKGVRYQGEIVRKKAGKAAKTASGA
ncbi:50S ribosomal protein L6 [Candidatus Saganbacteria bacterium]|nr:50S ribosomal protein L6 [Candidatus Saganbacteria bacterium]